MTFIDKANSQVDKAVSNRRKKELARDSGCKGKYALRQLTNHDRHLNTPVEPMHLLKNIVEHIVRLLSGCEDSCKVRMEEKVRKRFPSAWVRSAKTTTLPAAPFSLTTQEASIANTRLKSIQVPVGFGWKPRALFTSNLLGMKSHSWKQLVSTYILKYCLRGLLKQQQRETQFHFCNVLAKICSESVKIGLVEELTIDVHYSLSLLERDFPVSLHVSVFHLLHHLPFYLGRFGPPHVFWMFPFERFNSWVIRRVQNRRFPEATVVETYRLFEWAHLLQWSDELPTGAVTSPDDCQVEENDDCNVNSEGLGNYTELSPVQFANLEVLYSSTHLSPTRQVKKMDRYTYNDEHGRKVTLTGKGGDSMLATSSYIYIQIDGSLLFGQTQFFFEHSPDKRIFAYVDWFDKMHKESESELLFVFLDSVSSHNPIVHVSALLGPLVTAVDGDIPNKLWILSCTR